MILMSSASLWVFRQYGVQIVQPVQLLCGNKGCEVTCSVDNTSITGINAYYKVPLGPNSDIVYGMGLTTLPENIGSLTSLTSLWSWC